MPYAEGVTKRVAIGSKEGAPNFVMRIFELTPGVMPHYHSHDWEHEIFVLSGEGAVHTEQGDVPLKANDVAFIPANEKHGLMGGKGPEPFRFICVVPLRGEDTK